jgi:hypothetical protein
MPVTRKQVADALMTMQAVVETVRDAGRVPLGTVYATLMNRMDLAAYEKMVTLIVGTGLVRLENHELIWVG